MHKTYEPYTEDIQEIAHNMLVWLGVSDIDSVPQDVIDALEAIVEQYITYHHKELTKVMKYNDMTSMHEIDLMLAMIDIISAVLMDLKPVLVGFRREGTNADYSWDIATEGTEHTYFVFRSFQSEEEAREARYRGEDTLPVTVLATHRFKRASGALYDSELDNDQWSPYELKYRKAIPKGVELPVIKTPDFLKPYL